jgi:hypothetical protein
VVGLAETGLFVGLEVGAAEGCFVDSVGTAEGAFVLMVGAKVVGAAEVGVVVLMVGDAVTGALVGLKVGLLLEHDHEVPTHPLALHFLHA